MTYKTLHIKSISTKYPK